MARIEKTVFISYRRKDIAWALAVYQYLSNQKYDVFFDYTSIPSGDFEQIIVSNIKARAHFVVILTPTSLDRCSNPGDWLRREIETAIDEKRNIIPLFFDGFNFGSPSVAEKITGKLSIISHYNGLEIPSGYFIEAMERLSFRYLNVPLNAVLHPIPTEVQKVVKEEQVAADEALKQREDVKELIKPIEEKPREEQGIYERKDIDARAIGNISAKTPNRKTAIRLLIYIVMLSVVCLVVGFYGRTLVDMLTNVSLGSPTSISTHTPSITLTTLPSAFPTNTMTPRPPIITPSPMLDIGSTWTSPKDSMVMVYVPAGEFTMGSNYKPSPDEQSPSYLDNHPQHSVTLDSFWIDQTEVTNKEYELCVSDKVCSLPPISSSPRRFKYYGEPEFENFPVIYIDWLMARTYCEWAGRRLPTEAEWEKAARGTDGQIYPWGNGMPNNNLLNYNSVWSDTSIVRQYTGGQSPYFAYDMAGNVWEWTSSLYMPYPYNATDGREDLLAMGRRVLRGGSWHFDPTTVRSIFRAGAIPADQLVRSNLRSSSAPTDNGGVPLGFATVGFRCAMDATP